MELSEQANHYVRQVTLPDGKQIEVVYFEGGTKTDNPHWGSPGLHVCPKCNCDLVQPVDWDEVDNDLWAVEVRCPNCEWDDSGVFDRTSIEGFDELLDAGTDQLVTDLRQLERANMEEAIERFGYALSHDHLLPEDF